MGGGFSTIGGTGNLLLETSVVLLLLCPVFSLCFFLSFFFFFRLQSMWDLSSPTRDQTCIL